MDQYKNTLNACLTIQEDTKNKTHTHHSFSLHAESPADLTSSIMSLLTASSDMGIGGADEFEQFVVDHYDELMLLLKLLLKAAEYTYKRIRDHVEKRKEKLVSKTISIDLVVTYSSCCSACTIPPMDIEKQKEEIFKFMSDVERNFYATLPLDPPAPMGVG